MTSNNNQYPDGGIEAGILEEAAELELAKRPITTNWFVFITSGVFILGVALWTMVATDNAHTVLGAANEWIGRWFGWFYILLATLIVIFVIFIASSRYGKLKLGPPNSKPEFSAVSWASMLFAAGIGTDLMFFAVAEPITQYMYPPQIEGQTVAAAEEATVWTIFHYGISGWGMYALMGMALGYFAYRRGRPLAVRSALYPIFGERVNGRLGDFVDTAAMLGSIFGVATTLGIGVVQINVGLDLMFGIEQGIPAQVVLIIAAIVMAALSATSGVARGIRILSQLNVALAVALALWVLFAGRTDFLLNSLVMNIGDLVSGFPSMTADTMAFNDVSDWMNGWTLFFWAWWIAWASFVGMFLARISRGRTIRQFVVGVMTIPLMYIIMWISIFGNAALDRVISNDDMDFAERTIEAPEYGFFALILDYPISGVIVALSTFVALLFYVTSADSGALVMANLSSNLPSPRVDAKSWNRIFWAASTGLLTIGMLLVGGVPALQSAAVIMGLPFAFVMLLVMYGLYKALREDVAVIDARERSEKSIVAGGGSTSYSTEGRLWRQRLAQVFGQVTQKQATRYVDRVVEPALRELAEGLREEGDFAEVTRGDDDIIGDISSETIIYDRIKFTALEGDDEFVYRIVAISAPAPVYGARMVEQRDQSIRLEVHTNSETAVYDVVGYSHDAIINDCLNHLIRHREYLLVRDETTEA